MLYQCIDVLSLLLDLLIAVSFLPARCVELYINNNTANDE